MGVLKRGDRWYVKWRDAAGRWRRKATTARTKAEALRLFAELSVQADRQLKGLEARPLDVGLTLWGLCEWWLESKCPPLSLRRARNQLDVHVHRTVLGGLPLVAVTPEVLGAYFDRAARDGYAPRTINQLRAWLRRVFNAGRLARMWAGENPAQATQRREVPAQVRPTLESHEVPELLRGVRPTWQPFMALGVYLGLRKGEVCGLRKSDYDAARRLLYVGRSYQTELTKTKRADTLPVPLPLAHYLDLALKTRGPWLCPREDGKQRNENCSPEDNLRSALRRAGLIEGWMHKCRWCRRKPGATWKWQHDTDEKRRCPNRGCGRVLWPVAIARPLRFHDLRHTTATLLLRAGTPIQHVMRVMRHSAITTTVNTYGHLLTEDLRPHLEKLGPPPVQATPLRAVPPATS